MVSEMKLNEHDTLNSAIISVNFGSAFLEHNIV